MEGGSVITCCAAVPQQTDQVEVDFADSRHRRYDSPRRGASFCRRRGPKEQGMDLHDEGAILGDCGRVFVLSATRPLIHDAVQRDDQRLAREWRVGQEKARDQARKRLYASHRRCHRYDPLEYLVFAILILTPSASRISFASPLAAAARTVAANGRGNAHERAFVALTFGLHASHQRLEPTDKGDVRRLAQPGRPRWFGAPQF